MGALLQDPMNIVYLLGGVAVLLFILLIINTLGKKSRNAKIEELKQKISQMEKEVTLQKKQKSELQISTIEIKKSEQNLKEQMSYHEKIYKALIEKSPEQVWLLNGSGVFEECNYVDYFGTRFIPKDVIGKSFVDLFGSKGENIHRKTLFIMEQGTSVEKFVDSFIVNDAIIRKQISWFLLGEEANGSTLVFINDVTAKVEMEEYAEDLFNFSDNGIVLVQDSEIVKANKRFMNLCGYSEAELKRIPILTIISEREKRQLNDHINAMQGSIKGKIQVYKSIMNNKTGEKLPVIVTYVNVQINSVVSQLLIINDLSEAAREQRYLNELLVSLTKIFSINNEAVLIIDENNKPLFFNPLLPEMMGVGANTLIKKNISAFLNEIEKKIEDNTDFVEAFSNTDFPKDKIMEREFRLKNGKILSSKSSYARLDETTNCRIWSVKDVTLQKKRESELEKAKENAEFASSSKSQFLANMSHEIRTPMNGIIGVTTLMERTKLDQQQKRYLDIINVSANSLLDLINDILDISKIEAGYLKLENIVFNIEETINGVVDLLSLKAHERNLNFYVHISPETPVMFYGDPTRLRQILINLGNNAIKFTENGHIKISCKIDRKDNEEYIVHVTVSDTGVGIKADKVDSIFNSFQQEDITVFRKFGGTGLGLAISQKLTSMMDGDIWVESEYGKGSDFHFTMKLKTADNSQFKAEAEFFRKKGLKALLVCSDIQVVSYLSELLNYFRIENSIINDETKLITELVNSAKNKSPYDMLMMDYELKEIDYNKLFHHISVYSELDNLKKIILHSFHDDISNGFDGVITDYDTISKPIKKQEILRVVKKAMGIEDAPVIVSADQISGRLVSGIKILVAEDNEINQGIISELLEAEGNIVLIAANGEEAVDKFKSFEPDIILMDVNMPVMNGFEATEKIRQLENNSKRVPIIAMTADILFKDKEKCNEKGMDDFLEKPIKIDSLRRLLVNIFSDSNDAEDEIDELEEEPVETEFIDMEHIYDTLGDNSKVIKRTFELIVNRFPAALRDIRVSIKDNNGPELHRSAHGVKGFINYFNRSDLKKAILELEKCGKNNDFTKAQQIVIDIEPKINSFLKIVKQKLDELKS
ncbi:MAG: response regulator [Candidatus Cloacimonetes bacterium]|nr:response regulator [Candidatus Cloacimonadota bacterium]